MGYPISEYDVQLFKPKLTFLLIQIPLIVVTLFLLGLFGYSMIKTGHPDMMKMISYLFMAVFAVLAVIKPAISTLIRYLRFRVAVDNDGIRTYSGQIALQSMIWDEVTNIEVPTGKVGSKLILRAKSQSEIMSVPAGINKMSKLFTFIVSHASTSISRHHTIHRFTNRFPLFSLINIIVFFVFIPLFILWSYQNTNFSNLPVNPMTILGITSLFFILNIIMFYLSATLRAEISDTELILYKLFRTRKIPLSEIQSTSIRLTHKGQFFMLELFIILKNSKRKKIHFHGPDHFKLYAVLNEIIQIRHH